VFLCLTWGSTWLAIRLLVRDVPPFKAAAIRFLIAAAILFLWAWLRKSKWPKDERQWNAIVLLGFTIMAIPYGLLFWAEQYVASSMTAVLFSAMPLTVALFTPLMMQRTVPRKAVIALLIAFGGLLLLFFTQLSTSRRALLGGVAVLIAMVLSAWSVVYAKTRLQDVDPVVATALQLLVGAVALFWATWALESHQKTNWTTQAIAALIFLATFGSAAAFAVYYWLLKEMQPYQLSTTSLIVPVIAVLEGALFALEPVPPVMIVAVAVVLGSVGTVLRAEAESRQDNSALFAHSDRE
jgi:drug/metabolite transporter (DMT)-like permease